MSETIRRIHLHAEVDTTKCTHTLDEEYDSLDEMTEAVGEWTDGLFSEAPFGSDAFASITTTTAMIPNGAVVDYGDGRGLALKMRVADGRQNDDGTWTYSLDRIADE